MKVGGKLKFKDNGKPKIIKKKKEQEPQIEAIFKEHLKVKDKIIKFEPKQGSGLILTSGRGVNGEDTKFKEEIDKGDIIEIEHPVHKTKEERIVMLVLGDKSMMLDEAFSHDVTTFTNYTLRKADKVEKGHDLSEEYNKKLEEINKTKQIQKPIMSVRVKKGTWSYENKKVDISESMSKEDLLDIREKMIKDKFCW